MNTILTIIFRTLLMYFFVLVVLRLMGKREIGKLSIFDLVVSIMMAEIAVIVIEDPELLIHRGAVPILVLMITQIILSYVTLKSKKIRELVEGKPSILIENGKIKDEEMAKQRYTIDDLLTQIREKNIRSVADVEFAILETSGKLSVFPKPNNMDFEDYIGLPVPLVADGRIMSKNLEQINKDDIWLRKKLSQYGHPKIEDIYFASVDQTGNFYIDPMDEGRS